MDNPGIKTLGNQTITTAVTGLVITDWTDADGVAREYVGDLEGMTALTVQMKFAYGSGGTSLKAYLQTSLDQGQTWIDIACVVFGTASETAVLNFSGLTPKTTAVVPSDGALADDTAVDGILGDRLRVKITSIGTYAGGSQLTVRAAAR